MYEEVYMCFININFLLIFAACGEESGSDSIIALTEPTITEAEIETTTVPETEKETTELQTTTTAVKETTEAQTTVPQTTTTTVAQAAVADSSESSNSNLSGNSNGDLGGGGVTVLQAETGPSLVWVPVNGGTKYHSHAGCSGMIDPIQVTVETAIANGYTACKRCW